MSLITDIKKLRELEQQGDQSTLGWKMLDLAPAMLSVLECFRGGDAVKLDRIGRILERAFHDPTALLGYTREDRLDMLDCIKRHQKAAFLMEGQ